MLTIALAKGRLLEQSLELFNKCGIAFNNEGESRKLIFYSACGGYRILAVKPSDVPIYVERGAADIGISGRDTLLEEGKDVFELLDLGFGRCRMCVCGFLDKRPTAFSNLTVATKYVNFAQSYYRSLGVTADIIRLSGSVELAPLIGLSDVILDIVESGKTLKENGLCVLETIADISARFIANKASLKINQREIMQLKQRLEECKGD